MNGDKRGEWIGPWYSKDCAYHDEVYIDTSNFTIEIKDYGEVPNTIPRGRYSALEIMNMIAHVINDLCASFSIRSCLVYVSVESGRSIRMGCCNRAVPRLVLISENPFIEIIPGPYNEPGGVYLSCRFTFHRNWYIKMLELTSSYDFPLTVYNGLSKTNLENKYTYLNRGMTIFFKQPARIHFVGANPLLNADSFKGFIDWRQSQIVPTYDYSAMIRFPFHVMVLDSLEETLITCNEKT